MMNLKQKKKLIKWDEKITLAPIEQFEDMGVRSLVQLYRTMGKKRDAEKNEIKRKRLAEIHYEIWKELMDLAK